MTATTTQGLLIHQYGPHIFHTNSKQIFDHLSRFTEWRFYEHRVLAEVDGMLVPIPINLDTVNKLYGLNLTSEELQDWFAKRAEPVETIRTSEDVVVSAVGRELYEKFFRGYTRKQWGLDPSELDKSVTARVPTRTNRDDRYFGDEFQFMPKHGYTRLFESMLRHPNIHVMTQTDYADVKDVIPHRRVIYTGPIDEYFGFRFGKLPYRSLRFEHVTLDKAVAPAGRGRELSADPRLYPRHRVQAPDRPGARPDGADLRVSVRRGRPLLSDPEAGEPGAVQEIRAPGPGDPGRLVRRPACHLSLLQHGPDRRPGARHLPAHQRGAPVGADTTAVQVVAKSAALAS